MWKWERGARKGGGGGGGISVQKWGWRGMQAVVRGRQGEGKVGCLMPAEGDGGRWTGRREVMERGGVLPRERGGWTGMRGPMRRGYFCDGMPGWTYFSRATHHI